jgi:hypothetical protein
VNAYVVVLVATVVLKVVVATVAVTLAGGAVLVHVFRATGNLLEQAYNAGEYPMSAFTTMPARPLQVAWVGQDGFAAETTEQKPQSSAISDEIRILRFKTRGLY